MKDFDKVVRIGEIHPEWAGSGFSIFCKIEFKGGRLSISGVEGPLPNGDARGSCGQINMHEWGIVKYAPGWDAEKVAKFREVWESWHLNDMTPGCEHQNGPTWTPKDVKIYRFVMTNDTRSAKNEAKKAALNALEKGVTFTPTPEQSRLASLPYSLTSHLPEAPQGYAPDKRPNETKSTGWLREDEHPEGFLGKPCPVCGYRYGTKWLRREVPEAVLEWLKALPKTDTKPAWV